MDTDIDCALTKWNIEMADNAEIILVVIDVFPSPWISVPTNTSLATTQC